MSPLPFLISELLPEDDHYQDYEPGYRSDRNGFTGSSTAMPDGGSRGGGDNGFDNNHHLQQKQPQQFHPSLGMDKTNPFAALAAVQQHSLNSPLTANRQSPLQLRQASPFPHESTNSRRKQFHSNATAASSSSSGTLAAAAAAVAVPQDTSRKHRSNLTTNGE